MNPLEALLCEREWLLADGAMGTNLFDLGLTGGACGERWNLDAPERVASVHQAMVVAGADIVLTNTFGANRYRLALHGLGHQAIAINRAGAEIARRAAGAAGRPVLVAGSIGPTGDVLEPLGERTYAEAVDAFAEQAEGLRSGGADIAWIETLYAENELEAAMQAVASAGLPFISTMTFDTAGRTMMGIRPQEMPQLATCRTHRPLGIGANCGVGPAQLLDSILGIAASAARRRSSSRRATAASPSWATTCRCDTTAPRRSWPTTRAWRGMRAPGSSGAAAVPPHRISGRCAMPSRPARANRRRRMRPSRKFSVH